MRIQKYLYAVVTAISLLGFQPFASADTEGESSLRIFGSMASWDYEMTNGSITRPDLSAANARAAPRRSRTFFE